LGGKKEEKTESECKNTPHNSVLAYALKTPSECLHCDTYRTLKFKKDPILSKLEPLLNPNLKETQAANTLASHVGDNTHAHTQVLSREM